MCSLDVAVEATQVVGLLKQPCRTCLHVHLLSQMYFSISCMCVYFYNLHYKFDCLQHILAVLSFIWEHVCVEEQVTLFCLHTHGYLNSLYLHWSQPQTGCVIKLFITCSVFILDILENQVVQRSRCTCLESLNPLYPPEGGRILSMDGLNDAGWHYLSVTFLSALSTHSITMRYATR